MNTIEINGCQLPIKEYDGKRIVTFKEIDMVHGRPGGTARKRFNDNKTHFIEGEDYFVRKTDEAAREYGIIAPNGLVLITESGYLMLVKSFTDDLAWSVQRQLVKNYFRVQAGIAARPDSYTISDPVKRAQRWIEEQQEKQLLATTVVHQEAELNELKPKGIFADAVATSDSTILIGVLAKILKQNGVEIGQKRLFEYLRKNGYLISRKGSDYNTPTQRAMEMGLFEIKETAIPYPDGHTSINKTTKVTGKGQIYFINHFLHKEC